MRKYAPFLIMDEEDTPNSYDAPNRMTLTEFYKLIEQHRANIGLDPDKVTVILGIEEPNYSPIGAIYFYAPLNENGSWLK